MLRIQRYVGYIVEGCCAPSVEQAVGMAVLDERRWENAGSPAASVAARHAAGPVEARQHRYGP